MPAETIAYAASKVVLIAIDSLKLPGQIMGFIDLTLPWVQLFTLYNFIRIEFAPRQQ